MRKIMFIGRSEAGKTTLSQAMKGDTITYHKTQYVNHYDVIIDTPGEYAENRRHCLEATRSYQMCCLKKKSAFACPLNMRQV